LRFRGTGRRAQTAVEMLFIFGVMLAGIILLIPPYSQESSETVFAAAVRDGVSQATSFLNMGVVRWDSGEDVRAYDKLSWIINNGSLLNYRSAEIRLTSMSIDYGKDRIIVKLTFVRSSEDAKLDGILARNIGKFLQLYLSKIRGAELVEVSKNTYRLYYLGKRVIFDVTVNGRERVVG